MAWSNLLLAAGIEDFVQLLIPVIFVIIWVVSQVMQLGGAKKSKGELQGEVEEYDHWSEDEEQAEEKTASDPLSDEIEAFLRKVRGKEQESTPARQDSQRPAVARPAPIEASVVEAVPVATAVGDSEVAVSDRFSSQTARLGADVGQADERAEKHRHEAFDHAVGNLADTSVGAESEYEEGAGAAQDSEGVAVPVSASEFRDLLSTPESVRKAIVLNEILSRPTARW